MRIETVNAIYEDTFDSLVAKPGAATGKPVYECSCGEKYIYNMEIFSKKDSPSYQYNFTCCCGNKIKVFVKDIHFKE
jgi:hypothetical protein